MSEENPCIERGCTDIENCDEICEHQRIYTPAQMKKARKEEREKVLDYLDEWVNSGENLTLFKWELREELRKLRKQGEQR